MNRPPAFQFYPKDFLTDSSVILMSNEVVGIYIKLLCIDWLEDGIPEDTKLWMQLGHYDWFNEDGSLREMNDYSLAIAQLLPCFEKHPSKVGYVSNPRLQKERKKQLEHSLERSESGKKGAEIRWKNNEINNLNTDSSANGSAIQQPMAKNGSSSSSSSSFKSKDYKPQLSEEDIKYAFESLWSYFDKKGSKSNALEKFKKRFKTEKDLSMLEYAVENYLSQWEPDKSWRVKKALEFFLSDKVWTGYIPDDAEERWQQSQLKIAQGA